MPWCRCCASGTPISSPGQRARRPVAAVGRTVGQLGLPADCTIAVVIRGGLPLFPTAETRLAVGDELIAVTTTPNESRLRELL